jgi:hypothetical protein
MVGPLSAPADPPRRARGTHAGASVRRVMRRPAPKGGEAARARRSLRCRTGPPSPFLRPPDAPQITETLELTYPLDRAYVSLELRVSLEAAPPANASPGAQPSGAAVPLVWQVRRSAGRGMWRACVASHWQRVRGA